MPENQALSLAPFLAITRELAVLLVPIRPRPAFRETLESSLMMAARHAYALDALEISAPITSWAAQGRMLDWRGLAVAGRERRWVIGAAAFGSAVSVAGIMAYWWRQRGQRAA